MFKPNSTQNVKNNNKSDVNMNMKIQRYVYVCFIIIILPNDTLNSTDEQEAIHKASIHPKPKDTAMNLLL